VGQCHDSSRGISLFLSLFRISVQLSLEPAAAAFPFRGFCDCVTVTKALKAWLTVRGHVLPPRQHVPRTRAPTTAFSRYLGTKRLFRLTRARLVAPTDRNRQRSSLRP